MHRSRSSWTGRRWSRLPGSTSGMRRSRRASGSRPDARSTGSGGGDGRCNLRGDLAEAPEVPGAGLGGDLSDLVRVSMELAGECLSTALVWGMHCQQVAALVGHSGPELRERVLPRIGEGNVYVASVTSEKGKGGHLLSAEAPLRRENGSLLLERDAPIVTGALQADGFLVTMRDSDSAPPNAVTLVYADREDLTVEASGSWNPMGMRGTHSVAVKLAGRLPESSVVGRPGDFRTVAMTSFIPAGHIAWA